MSKTWKKNRSHNEFQSDYEYSEFKRNRKNAVRQGRKVSHYTNKQFREFMFSFE